MLRRQLRGLRGGSVGFFHKTGDVSTVRSRALSGQPRLANGGGRSMVTRTWHRLQIAGRGESGESCAASVKVKQSRARVRGRAAVALSS